MKKKIALLLAAIMTVSSLPMTAMASTTNTVSKIPTVEDDTDFTSSIIIDEFKGIATGEESQTVKLTLTNAEFRDEQFSSEEDVKGEGVATPIYDECDEENVITNYSELTEEDVISALKGYNKDNVDVDTVLEPDGDKNIVYYSADEGKTKYLKVEDKYYLAEDVDGTLTRVITGYTDKDGKTLTLKDGKYYYDTAAYYIDEKGNKVDKDGYLVDENGDRVKVNTINGVKYTKISDNVAMAEFTADSNSSITLSLYCTADGEGDASVTIENVDSVVSSQTLKIANVASGSTTINVSDTVSITEGGTKINNIVLTETTAGTLEDGTLRIRLSNGFEFLESKTPEIIVFPSENGSLSITFDKYDNDGQDALFTVTGSSTTAATISIGNLYVAYNDDDVEVGDECNITVSGAGITKETINVGNSADYGLSFEAEDEDIPVFYSGTYDDDVETLEVTLEENIANSWLEDRKTKIIFPEGVEPISVDLGDTKNCNISEDNFEFDENEVTISGVTRKNNTDKIELSATFTLSVSPDFTGDITATLSGSAVGDDIEVTVGEAKMPVTVEAETNDLVIDYRNTEASDIVITEVDAGALKKGTTVTLAIDGIAFDGTPTVEVTEGDMKIENVKVKDDTIRFDIKTESQKEPAEITISDISLYMDRNLPSGEYDLMFVASDEATNKNGTFDLSDDAIIRNYGSDTDQQGIFDVDEVVAKEGYVNVITSGRDEGDNAFTTQIVVPIGSYTIYSNGKEIAVDTPAYISNGYTMMPVRAVTEALSGTAIVRWDDPTDTVTIQMGSRVISMTVGSKVMNINGVEVAMQAECEITNSRAFIPLRDLGYALGLSDDEINWDDSTKTATLN